MEDLFSSIKQVISERLASPLVGSFVVAWILWNYRFLVILLSDASVTQTFKMIESIAFPNTWTLVFRGVFLPLTAALLYVFAYPYPARFVYAFTLKQKMAGNKLKQQIEEETLLSLKESRRIRGEYAQLDRKNQETIDRLNSEISRLSDALEQTQEPPKDGNNVNLREDPPVEIKRSQLKLLKLLETLGGRAGEGHFKNKSTESKTRTEFDIGELKRLGLISEESDSDGDIDYVFTHEGRGVLLDDENDKSNMNRTRASTGNLASIVQNERNSDSQESR